MTLQNAISYIESGLNHAPGLLQDARNFSNLVSSQMIHFDTLQESALSASTAQFADDGSIEELARMLRVWNLSSPNDTHETIRWKSRHKYELHRLRGTPAGIKLILSQFPISTDHFTPITVYNDIGDRAITMPSFPSVESPLVVSCYADGMVVDNTTPINSVVLGTGFRDEDVMNRRSVFFYHQQIIDAVLLMKDPRNTLLYVEIFFGFDGVKFWSMSR